MTTQYGSRLDTFIAPDAYNAVWPVTPPADLSLLGSDFRPSFFYNRYGFIGPGSKAAGFDKRDRPILRRLGIFSNFADGLVFNNTQWNSAGGSIIRFDFSTWGAQLTGTITVTGTAIAGAGTLFTRELAPGMRVSYTDSAGLIRLGLINTITSDTVAAFTTSPGNSGATLGWPELIPAVNQIEIPVPALNEMFTQSYFLGDVSKILTAYSGTITATSGSPTITGVNTRFLTEFYNVTAFQFIRWTDDAGNMVTRQISSIASDTSLTLVTNAPSNATGVALLVPFNHTRVVGRINAGLDFSTISIDPAFATKRLQFGMVAEMEHTYDMAVGI